MSLEHYGILPEEIQEMIFIDPDYGYTFGTDKVCFNKPAIFSTVQFRLIDTDELNKIGDAIRTENGFRPLYSGDNQNENGWYEWYISVNDYTDSMTDSCLVFYPNETGEEDLKLGFVTINEEEQKIIFQLLNDDCLRYFGKSCFELISEAKMEVIASEND